MADVTYHGVSRSHWDSLDPSQPYLPPGFEKDGFIHCTDGEERIASVLTLHYKDEPGDWLLLTIDKSRVSAPIRCEDSDDAFPHIYGALNRDAIMDVRPIVRAHDGTFLLPG